MKTPKKAVLKKMFAPLKKPLEAYIEGNFLTVKIPLLKKPRYFFNTYAGRLCVVAESYTWVETMANVGGQQLLLNFQAVLPPKMAR